MTIRPSSIAEALARRSQQQRDAERAETRSALAAEREAHYTRRYAELDSYVALSRTNPAAFAALPAQTRHDAALRAAYLANRTTAQGGSR